MYRARSRILQDSLTPSLPCTSVWSEYYGGLFLTPVAEASYVTAVAYPTRMWGSVHGAFRTIYSKTDGPTAIFVELSRPAYRTSTHSLDY